MYTLLAVSHSINIYIVCKNGSGVLRKFYRNAPHIIHDGGFVEFILLYNNIEEKLPHIS
ncbi:hypothetical protein C2G38_378837 [Gigaspora rosea]|uniref:Uncharacterized protein n=1 Tax=Gigaspora rosea TaxID=44941 RepID=A0A397UD20_9GLOM|nr:hypothetical protein C2G38_378837 [Gigaspora rosea]